MATRTQQPVGLHPEAWYTLADFRSILGISETRMRLARREGLDLPTLRLGKRKMVCGADGIAYLKGLAELERVAREGAETRPDRGDPSPN